MQKCIGLDLSDTLNRMRRSKIKPSFFLPDSIPGANLKIIFKTAQSPRKNPLN
jgi:hypothetical protein